MLILLLLSEGIWSNLKYLLMLYDDENLSDNIIGLIRIKISLRNKYYVSIKYSTSTDYVEKIVISYDQPVYGKR
jgi:hypothetical protein